MPRLASVLLNAKADGREPAIADRPAWEAFASASLEKIFGVKPQGKLTVQSEKDGFSYTWSDEISPDDVAAAVTTLEKTKHVFGLCHAVMTAVENRNLMVPQFETDDSAKVTAGMAVLAVAQLPLQVVGAGYADTPAVEDLARRGPLAELWRVEITAASGVSAQYLVDPQAGKLVTASLPQHSQKD